jgi:TetR/AcrR family transcriptional regulator, hemagglutinin/protease regulatory protein
VPKPSTNTTRVAKPTSTTERVRAKRLAPDARRAQILDCALAVFARDGLSNATHASIAAAAGVAEATVFVYFPTRGELERAVLSEISRFLLEDIVAPLHNADEPAAAILEKTLVTFAACIESHPHHARVWLEWSTAVRGDLWPLYLEFQKQVIDYFRATIKRGLRDQVLFNALATDDAARVLVGLGHMIALMKFAGSTQAEIQRLVHSLMQGFITQEGKLHPKRLLSSRD